MNAIKQTKTILQILGIGVFAAGLGLKAQTAGAEEQGGGAAAGEAASALILAGSIAPTRITLEKNTSLYLTRLEKVDLGAFAFSSPRQSNPEPFVLKPGFITEDGQKTKPVNFSSLDHFLVSLTEQNRDREKSTFEYNHGSYATQQGDLPTLSKSNLLNSRFANLVMKNLTGNK